MDEQPTGQPSVQITQNLLQSYFKDYWYYAIEMLPGVFSPGQRHPNVALTRRLLSRCDVAGTRCLDIGTMEAMIPVLLKRRGAKSVFATDMYDLFQKVTLVKQATLTDFEYIPKLRLERTVEYLAGIGEVNFDLVVLSGVLYHVFDPMHTLGVARSLVRPGGIVIVETAAVAEDSFAMYFNDQGRYYFDWTSFWFITAPSLDSILRYYRLAPLDCVFLRANMIGGKPICRIAVACRATGDCVPLKKDLWMRDATKAFDYSGAIDWQHSEKSAITTDVRYDLTDLQLPLHPGINTCDLGGIVKSCKPLEVVPEQLQLGLSDII